MHGDGQHIIEKLTIEVSVPDLSEGFRIKDNVAAFVDRYVMPAVERYLQEMEQDVPPGRILRIDRLQIDLNAPSGSLEDSGSISATVAFELEEAFGKSLDDIRREQQSSFADPVHEMVMESGNAGEKPQLTTIQPSVRMIEAFLHFLENGTRPWWISRPGELDTLLSGKTLQEWEPAERTKLAEAVRRKLRSSSVKQRLVRQLTDEALIAVLQPAGEQAAKAKPEKQLRLLEEFLRLLEKEARIPVSVRTRERIWELLFGLMPGIPDRQSLSPEALLAMMERKLPMDYPEIKPEKLVLLARTFIRLAEAFSGESFPETETKAVAAAFAAEKIPERRQQARPDQPGQQGTQEKQEQREQQAQQQTPGSTTADSESRSQTAEEREQEKQPKGPKQQNERKQESDRAQTPEKKSDHRESLSDKEREAVYKTPKVLPDEAIYVDNAGLVIVHPFLKHLFLNTGQLEGNTFLDPVLAVHMLHYLVTGQEQAYEHEMLFEKYLVGIPQEESIPRMVPLGEALREEIASLLDAVKENWPEMAHSSHEAIRETFLQRPGKLIPEEPHPRLVVERKTVDILMDRLGWTISIVRFPWKDDILYVEW